MYFPYLRGRQFELIALRELVEMSLIGENIIPIIEPVKMSSTLVTTLSAFCEKNSRIALILNPKVGNFDIDKKEEKNGKNHDKFIEIIKNKCVIPTHLMVKNSSRIITELNLLGIKKAEEIVICTDEDFLDNYSECFTKESPLYTLIPDESEFRREIHINRVKLADKFKKLSRNTDYAKKPDEPFSNDHLYYISDGYVGFSDYSIFGDDYSDSGFAPYAVAIHIVYFDANEKLRVKHFVSDTNDDIHDPAAKFSEAVGKLVMWNKTENLNTYGIQQLTEMNDNENYPGLGIVKKLSLMHHLELMNNYLDRK